MALYNTSKKSIGNYEVGDLFLTTNTINPSVRFGGTWELVAKGRTLVGVDPDQKEFNTVKKTGGEKSHTLTVNEMPSHTHDIDPAICLDAGENLYRLSWQYDGIDDWAKIKTMSAGGSQPHNNLQPYFTCYIWMKIS